MGTPLRPILHFCHHDNSLKPTNLELLTEQKNKFEILGASISRTRHSIKNRSAHSNQGPQIPAVPTK